MKVNFNITFELVTKIMVPIISGFIALESYIYFKGKADANKQNIVTINDAKLNHTVLVLDSILRVINNVNSKVKVLFYYHITDSIHTIKQDKTINNHTNSLVQLGTMQLKNHNELMNFMIPYLNGYKINKDTSELKKKECQYLTLR